MYITVTTAILITWDTAVPMAITATNRATANAASMSSRRILSWA